MDRRTSRERKKQQTGRREERRRQTKKKKKKKKKEKKREISNQILIYTAPVVFTTTTASMPKQSRLSCPPRMRKTAIQIKAESCRVVTFDTPVVTLLDDQRDSVSVRAGWRGASFCCDLVRQQVCSVVSDSVWQYGNVS